MPENYTLASDGIYQPNFVVQHRDDEYPEDGFDGLFAMQEKHFWYQGRHRFLLHALGRHHPGSIEPLSAIDLGGGAGGWVRYLAKQRASDYAPLALADSSRTALTMAHQILPERVERYHIDLMNLGFQEQWDIAFLLDVIEHLPDDVEAMRQAWKALKPGGLLFVATPAFQQFWSYNDDLACHLRRYTRADYGRLADQSGFELLDSRYFMFFLSPLYLLARRAGRVASLTDEQKKEMAKNEHTIPPPLINFTLSCVFACETPLGHWMHFPWGTSILGVFRKP